MKKKILLIQPTPYDQYGKLVKKSRLYFVGLALPLLAALTPEDFEGYMKWSGTEYVYVAAEYFAPENRVWAKDLVDQMMLRGDFTDLFFENGNCLMRVLPAGSEERPDPEQAKRNLEAYHTFTAGFTH